jgi:hypothetical protein
VLIWLQYTKNILNYQIYLQQLHWLFEPQDELHSSFDSQIHSVQLHSFII